MVTVRNEYLTLRVDEFGAQMTELCSNKGTEYLWNADKTYWGENAPVLFPFVGRMTDGNYILRGARYSMPLHGFAKRNTFAIEEQTAESVTFALRDTDETRKEYPFRFTFRVRYALRDSSVAVTYFVKNDGDDTMPFGIGGHPGFRVPLAEGTKFEDYEIRFPEPCMPDRIGFSDTGYLDGTALPYPLKDGVSIPLRHDLFDCDAIVLRHTPRSVTIRSDKTSRSVTVDFPGMPYIGFWHMPKTDAPYVCIEPWVSLPSRQDIVEDLAFKADLTRLAPGEEYTNEWKITVTDE